MHHSPLSRHKPPPGQLSVTSERMGLKRNHAVGIGEHVRPRALPPGALAGCTPRVQSHPTVSPSRWAKGDWRARPSRCPGRPRSPLSAQARLSIVVCITAGRGATILFGYEHNPSERRLTKTKAEGAFRRRSRLTKHGESVMGKGPATVSFAWLLILTSGRD